MLKRADGRWENPATIHPHNDVSIPKLIFERVKRTPDNVIVERRMGDEWHGVKGAEFAAQVQSLAQGFYGLGVRPGTRVAILAPTSYEWALLDVAALSLGAVTVPIYESDSAAQISHILADSKPLVVVTQTAQQADLINSIKKRSVRHVFALERGAGRELVAAGLDVDPQVVEDHYTKLTLDDLATIVYTSGTTGPPKGVLLTHGNFVSPIMQAYDILPKLINDPDSRVLLFLPVAHVLARFVMHAILVGEGTLGFSPDTRHLLHDISTFQPSMMLVVPRVLEKVYNTASQKAGAGVKKTLFGWSAKQARSISESTAYPPPADEKDRAELEIPGVERDTRNVLSSDGPTFTGKTKYRIANALALRKIRQVFGPNLDTVICGGAPLGQDLANFYRGLGITLLQGYGLSETTGPITVQSPTDNPPDSVGYLWPGNSLKILPDGELLLRGISVSRGYHNLPKDTAASHRDGWFHTGDLAEVDGEGRLKITGRKKELIVTAGGKNVSPDVLQDSLNSHPLISQVIVAGDGKPYIAAMVTLDEEMLPIWLRNKGLDVVPTAMAADLPEVRDSIARAILRANGEVSRAESIRRYRILNQDFTVENGYLTPSLKLKRNKVLRDFAREVEDIYEASEEEVQAFGGSIREHESDNHK